MTEKYEPHQYLTTEANVEFGRMVAKVQRLNRRMRLVQRQIEILCSVLLNYITSEQTKDAIAQIENLSTLARRHQAADENGVSHDE